VLCPWLAQTADWASGRKTAGPHFVPIDLAPRRRCGQPTSGTDSPPITCFTFLDAVRALALRQVRANRRNTSREPYPPPPPSARLIHRHAPRLFSSRCIGRFP